jgi:hypothetical protein
MSSGKKDIASKADKRTNPLTVLQYSQGILLVCLEWSSRPLGYLSTTSPLVFSPFLWYIQPQQDVVKGTISSHKISYRKKRRFYIYWKYKDVASCIIGGKNLWGYLGFLKKFGT